MKRGKRRKKKTEIKTPKRTIFLFGEPHSGDQTRSRGQNGAIINPELARAIAIRGSLVRSPTYRPEINDMKDSPHGGKKKYVRKKYNLKKMMIYEQNILPKYGIVVATAEQF